ncbi:MAG: hypothetical protein ACEQR7_06065 [Agathobacter rectalis]
MTDLLNDPTIHTIVLIGSIGTGKTDVAAHIGISLAYQFPKTYFTVFRQNISTAKRSIIPSYLNMLDLMNFEEDVDYRYNKQDFEITFPHNQSKIGFVEADVTKDRQGRKIKGINATANHIDEGDELDETMFITATSRRGRRNTNGQPSISIITMNPNDSHLKAKYYDPWKNPKEYGPLPIGVAVIEFTIEDSWQTKEDIAAMMTNPMPWVERYIKNNWNYKDDIDSLFKYRFFDAALTKDVTSQDKNTIGYDVARSGTDRSVIALWWGKVLMDIVIIKDKRDQMKTDDQALELIKYMTQNAVVAENVAVDAVGLGVGVIDHMHSKGIIVKEFVSGASPYMSEADKRKGIPSRYDNLRSQVIYEFSQGLEKGIYKIYESCPFRKELISEAMLHNHETTDKKLNVESKEKIKERTGGMSPDIFDAVVMGLFPQLNIDTQNDSSRIGF